MADAITEATGHDVHLTPGDRGEFTLWVGDTVVAQKSRETGFPDDAGCVAAVQAAL